MPVFQITSVLAGEAFIPDNPDVSRKLRLHATPGILVSRNFGVALTSGNAPIHGGYGKLHFYVSSGPSDLTITTLDGTAVTIQALATNTQINLDIGFYKASWTGTATAVAYGME